tara:strand:+ start:851 stop:1066 length:216 start_codon:yes stop_codon:yes gene_type:complete
MTVEQKLSNLETAYIKWSEKENGFEDAGYIWWEREKDCQEWSTKERTYVPMSATKTLRIMRGWVKRQKSFS